MLNFADIKDYKLKVIFLIHFFLTTLSCLGQWESDSLFFYNLMLLFCLTWGISRSVNEEPLQLALAINLTSIVFDIALLCGNFPSTYWPNQFFSGMVCLVTIICRPCTSYLLAKDIQERLGKTGPLTVTDIFLTNGRRGNSRDESNKNTPSPQLSQQDFGILAIS